MTSQDQDH